MGEQRVRIVAGTYRGRVVQAPTGETTRPTSDRVREAVFSAVGSIAGSDLGGGAVLDAFAGSGALGLEALSRGCTHVVFAEQDRGRGAGHSSQRRRPRSRAELHRRRPVTYSLLPSARACRTRRIRCLCSTLHIDLTRFRWRRSWRLSPRMGSLRTVLWSCGNTAPIRVSSGLRASRRRRASATDPLQSTLPYLRGELRTT